MNVAEIILGRANGQQLALVALILTHPNPGQFAAVLEQLLAHGEVDWAQSGNAVSADAKAAARDYVRELVDTARDEAAKRGAPPAR